ncbi:MAG: PaaI family thioesterase [Robiginitomaculum sp.]|nr:PaaI family thioesterase [Robiginitomaculum sp.]
MPKVSPDDINQAMKIAFPLNHDDLAEVIETRKGYARTRLLVKPHYIRPGEYISGPTQMGMVDHAAYAAVFTLTGLELMALTANINIDFLKPCQGSVVDARATIIETGKRSLTCEVIITTDKNFNPSSRARVKYVLPRTS